MPLVSARQWLIDELAANGLWPAEAEVVWRAHCEPSIVSMQGRWEEDFGNISGAERSRVKLLACAHAVEWINANKPDHLAKSNLKLMLI